MTSEERKEGRYQRRRAGREAKRRARSEACGSFEQVFSYENLYKAGLACCKGRALEVLDAAVSGEFV